MHANDFVHSLAGVEHAKAGEMSEHHYIEVYVDPEHRDALVELLTGDTHEMGVGGDGQWTLEWEEESPSRHRIHFTVDKEFNEDW